MINKANRYDEYAYRVAYRELDPSVDSVEEGQWITINDQGKIIVSDGSKKSFLCTGSKRDGRDQVSGKPVKKIAYAVGAFELSVTNFNAAGTYANMTPLKVADGGVLTPWESATDGAQLIEAYALGAPVSGELRICKA